MVNKNKGFTLIELLVVIAIIGILSSVVLASLNTARNKGADAAVKSNLTNIRAQAELDYDGTNPNNYSGVCQNTQVVNAVAAAGNAGGGTAICHDTTESVSTDGWAAAAPLKQGGFFCVDYTGVSTTTSGTTNPIAGPTDVTCN